MEVGLGAEYNSFDDLNKAINEYSRVNNVVYVIGDCRTVESANKRLSSKNPVLYHSKFKYAYVKFTCKHFGEAKSKSTGKRPNQRTYKTDCHSYLHATVDRNKDKLVITSCVLDHNHDRSRDLFLQYPEQRRVTEEEKEIVQTLSKLCVAPSAISKHIFDLSGKCLTVKDVQNIRRKSTVSCELEEILEVLENIGGADEDNVVVVHAKEDGEIQGIFFQTAEQRNLLQKYPEVVHVDGTYRVNNRRLSLYVALIEDGEGRGAAVAYALLCSETKESIEFFIRSLKENNEPALKGTGCFIIDKDFTEYAVISREFPSANIQICLFHVLKTLRQEINKLQVDETSKDRVRKCTQDMIYANTKLLYDQLLQELQMISPDSFFQYFCNNWDSCENLWATHVTNSLPNFRTRTNNRIERHNQELKKVLNSHMTVADCIRAILGKVDEQTSRKQHRSSLSSVCRYYNVQDNDSNIQQIRNVATGYASKLMVHQLNRAKELGASTSVHLDGTSASVALEGDVHNVNLELEASCSCSFWLSLHLPCRHMFMVMFEARLDFRESWVPLRWRRSYQVADVRAHGTNAQPGLRLQKSNPVISTKLTRSEKFNKMKRVLLQIGDLCSEVSADEFEHRFEQILTLKSAWMEGQIVNVSVDVEGGHVPTFQEGVNVKPNALPMGTPKRKTTHLQQSSEAPDVNAEGALPAKRRKKAPRDDTSHDAVGRNVRPVQKTVPSKRSQEDAEDYMSHDAPDARPVQKTVPSKRSGKAAKDDTSHDASGARPVQKTVSFKRSGKAAKDDTSHDAPDARPMPKTVPSKRSRKADKDDTSHDASGARPVQKTVPSKRSGKAVKHDTSHDAPDVRPVQKTVPSRRNDKAAEDDTSHDAPDARPVQKTVPSKRSGKAAKDDTSHDAPDARPVQKTVPSKRGGKAAKDDTSHDAPDKRPVQKTVPSKRNDEAAKDDTSHDAPDARPLQKTVPSKRSGKAAKDDTTHNANDVRPVQKTVPSKESEEAATDDTSHDAPDVKPVPLKSCLKRKSTDGLYLPKIKKVKGRPKGCNSSVIGVTVKLTKATKQKSCNKVESEGAMLDRKVLQCFGEKRLSELFKLIKSVKLDKPKGVYGGLSMMQTKVMSPANGLIFEAGQHEKQLDIVTDVLTSQIAGLISGPSPQRNTDMFQLLTSAVYLSIKDDLDLRSMEDLLSCKPSHLLRVSDSDSEDVHSKLKVGNNSFTKGDLATLRHGKWLNDKVIHSHLGLLMMEHPGKVYVLPSFLALKWDKGLYQEWLYKKIDFGSFRWVILPINKNQHWFLMVVDMLHNTVGILNSLSSKETEVQYIGHWKYYMRVRNMHTSFCHPEFTAVTYPCGRQYDGHSCGIFVLMNAEAILAGSKPAIMRQHHCYMYRHYVRRRLLGSATTNEDIMCDLPFCAKPSGKIIWACCDHCDRWCHLVCCNVSSVDRKAVSLCTLCQYDTH